MLSYIIGFIIVASGIYILVRSVKKEVSDGCYACPSRDKCEIRKRSGSCSADCDLKDKQ